MSKTLYGSITVEVGEKTYELIPTLDAVRRIEARFGGLRGASQALNALSVDGAAHIIASGAGLTERRAEALPEEVWKAGVLDVSVQLNAYLVALYNPRGIEKGNVHPGAE